MTENSFDYQNGNPDSNRPNAKKKRGKLVLLIACIVVLAAAGGSVAAYMRWPEIGAHLGIAEKQYQLGEQYEYGRNGKEIDREQAFEWYRKAAKKGHASAQFVIGLAYQFGDGMKKDTDVAEEWFDKAFEGLEKAAKKGRGREQNQLGIHRYPIKE